MVDVKFAPETVIFDITEGGEYDNYLYRCLVGPMSKRYRKRIEYLSKAIPEGFRKKLLIFNGKIVGQIEYSPAEVSYYPISGDNVIVMNCIWVLRKAKGHSFGRLLLENMIKSEDAASCFATIALQNHWSPWFRKCQLEKLGFKPLRSFNVTHMTKHREQVFSIHLMWIPTSPDAEPPTWDQKRLLKGTTACTAHPLYHPQTHRPDQILEMHQL